MENEILETGTTPETVETVETTEAAPVAEKKSFADTIKSLPGTIVAKTKDLWANRATAVEKIKSVPKKVWMMIGGSIVALVAIIVTLCLVFNNYKTPIKLMQAVENNKNASKAYDKQVKIVNGLCEKDLKTILKIYKKTDAYDDSVENLEENIEAVKEELGNNYKYKYKVVDKEKLDKDELKEVQKSLRSSGRTLYNNYKGMDSDDYEDLADTLDIKKSQAKKVAKAAANIGKTLKGAKITKGYELTLEVSLSGSEIDDFEPYETTIYVYKVNGRWVSSRAFSLLLDPTGMFN